MRWLIGIGIGVGIGVLVYRKVLRTAESMTPGGLADSARESAAGLMDSVRDFIDDVRDGMTEREDELLEALSGEVDLTDVLAGQEQRR